MGEDLLLHVPVLPILLPKVPTLPAPMEADSLVTTKGSRRGCRPELRRCWDWCREAALGVVDSAMPLGHQEGIYERRRRAYGGGGGEDVLGQLWCGSGLSQSGGLCSPKR